MSDDRWDDRDHQRRQPRLPFNGGDRVPRKAKPPRSSFSPPLRTADRPLIIPTTPRDQEIRWRPWPGRAALARPPCITADCGKPAMCWAVCRCGKLFAYCNVCAPDPARAGAERAACHPGPTPTLRSVPL